MIDLLVGMIAMASAVAGLFFLRFWKNTGDRFFLYFAASFFLEAANRIAAEMMGIVREAAPEYYLVRLISYGLILWAIAEKNWPRHKGDD